MTLTEDIILPDHLNHQLILKNVLLQFQKDFGDNCPNFSDLNKPYVIHDIWFKVELQTTLLLEAAPEKFFQILYLIDLPEDLFRQALSHDDTSKVLSLLIFKRELQKVIFKMQYS